MRRLAILTTVLLFALAVSAAAKPVTVKFKTGTYSAKTSQGAHFKFKIEAHTTADRCGSSASAHCFIAISYPTITEPCTTGSSGGGMFSVPNGFVNGKGNFSYHQSLSGPQQPLIAFTAHASGSKVTGTLREKTTTAPATHATPAPFVGQRIAASAQPFVRELAACARPTGQGRGRRPRGVSGDPDRVR